MATKETLNKKTIETEVEVIEKPYTLRKLKDGDLFPIIAILKKIGVSQLKSAFVNVTSGDKDVKKIGINVVFDMAGILVSNIDKAEDDIYSLWSDISGIPVDEMKKLEFGTLPMMIFDTFSEVKNTNFFKVLSKLL